MEYDVTRTYQQIRDIRLPHNASPSWASRLLEPGLPNGSALLVVLPRRGGKTWLARALEHRRGGKFIDLRTGSIPKPHQAPALVLLDEPGTTLEHSPTTLGSALSALRSASKEAIVFLTPGELAQLRPHLGAEVDKDIIRPELLSSIEVERLAARTDWASAVITVLQDRDPGWLRSAFLLELVLHCAEVDVDRRLNVEALIDAAISQARARLYVQAVYDNGLTLQQRSLMRIARWSHCLGVPHPQIADPDLLSLLADPVIGRHLPPPLRIHHLSDLHHGPKLRQVADIKDRTDAGHAIGAVAGTGTPLDFYLRHLEALPAEDRPHLVIVTGDLVEYPSDEYAKQAVRWLDTLRSLLAEHPTLAKDEPRILLVGGNHDVAWDRCLEEDGQARHEWFSETFADYPHPELHLPSNKRRLDVRYPGFGLRVLLLGSAEVSGEIRDDAERVKAQTDLVDRYKAASAADKHNLIMSLERLDPSVVSRVILDRIKKVSGWTTIAALHHPVSPVPSVEVAPYTDMVNAGQVKLCLANATTSLVLHGHTHQRFLASERLMPVPGGWTIRIAGAATLGSSQTSEQNGFNEILGLFEGGEPTFGIQPFELAGGHWRAAEQTVFFRPGEPAELTFAEAVTDS